MKVLRCTPEYFDVVYKINPHMKVGSVDLRKAKEQWEGLGKVYERVGISCEVIQGRAGLPDMVFAANSGLPFKKASGRKAFLRSQMKNEERKGEVPHYAEWFKQNGFDLVHLPDNNIPFEGMGDLIYSSDRSFLFGGYGFRTSKEILPFIQDLTGISVHPLHLVDPAFYHLDTCLCVLNKESALVYPAAFDASSYEFLKETFGDLIPVTKEEAYRFVCNAHCPNEVHVILQQGSPRVEEELMRCGFKPLPVETGEFLKSGGSVSCMKLELE